MRDQSDNPILLAVLGAAGLLMARANVAPLPISVDPAPVEAHAFRRPKPRAGKAKPAPTSGAWSLLKRVGSETLDNQLMTQAAAVTFYALLSIFPAMAALVSIFGLIADPATITDQLNSLSGMIPGGGQELLNGELHTLTAAGSKGLGWALGLGIATSLWTSNQAMKAMFNALDAVHEVKETRGYVKLTAVTLLCTFGVIVFTLVAMTAVVVAPVVLHFVDPSGLTAPLIRWLRWPFLLVAVSALLAVLYRFGPCRTKVVWRWVTWGSLFAAVTWVLVSVLFSWYVANFGTFNQTYGALGAVVGFMTWIWISSTVVLIGAQVDAELEKATVGRQKAV